MKNKLVEHIKDELAKGAIITQSIPLFLRDAFEAVTLNIKYIENILK